ncbi:MAG: SDR family oxidoreductase [Gemmatimonadales bacterium]|jgi:NAD(P)-dependent dehydrogenase (short-subunit alcohol dehydrogenase family)
MDLELAGKTVVVTGGAQGIGEAVVRALAEEAAVPVIVDRDEAAGARVRDGLAADGRRCELVVCDLVEPGACTSAVERATRLAGAPFGLVNNAGVNDGVSLDDGSAEEFVGSLRRNVVHYYEMAQAALPALKQTRGAIVNVASKVALTGQGGTSGYAASKGAILALTREWAVDLLPYTVRVNAVVPAETMTPHYRQWLERSPNPEEKLATITGKIPLGRRMTTPEEIAATVVFLLSPRAGHITGEHLLVDGGYVHLDRLLT